MAVLNENNAHPHVSNERITIVHNGIIENHQQLKQRLSEQGFEFVTDTDSEDLPSYSLLLEGHTSSY